MYFKEKENTNIDGEFQGKKSFDFKKNKLLIVFIVGILVLFIIVFIMFKLSRPKEEQEITYNIDFNGSKEITITLGNDYIEPGYKAYDSNGNDLTHLVSISSQVNINQPGTYEITYTVHGKTETRYVTVKNQEEETYIYLKGDKNMYLDLNEKYIEPGYVSHDTIDGALTNKVKVSGTVNTKQKGLYKIIYTVTNSRNITTQVERNVIVGETKPQE